MKKNAHKVVAATRKMFDGYYSQQIVIPPTMNTADFLRAYGDIGWLFACVNRISQNIGSSEWKAYKGETVQKTSLALEVLKHPNRFMSQFQLMWKTTAYLELTGRAFWYVAKDSLGRPKEIWCLNPIDVWIVPDKDNFIKGYMYKAGAIQIPLDIDEVIFFSLPDLINPYGGKGPAQAAANDLEAEKYTSQYVRNFFYNDARPSGIVTFPEIDDTDYDRAKEEWQDKYKGVANSNKIAFVRGEGVSFTPITMNIKDLDVSSLKDKSRDGILGTFGVPKSILGITDDVNRANAETAEYTFAKHTIKPILQLMQDIINNELIPMFKEAIELKFTDPVPENKDFTKAVLDSQVDKSITKNEAREVLNKLMGWNLQPIEGGDTVYQPVSQQPMGTALPAASNMPKEPLPPEKNLKKKDKILRIKGKFEDKEAYWKAFVNKTDAWEKELKPVWEKIFKHQKEKIIANIKSHKSIMVSKEDDSLDFLFSSEEVKYITENLLPLLKKIIKDKGEQVINELEVDMSFDLHNPLVTEYLSKYCATQIHDINSFTETMIREQLKQGEEAGESIPDLCSRIDQYFNNMEGYRVERIARTEVISSSNQGALIGYKQSEVVEKKEWLTAIDGRERSWHLKANGQVVDIEDYFIVDGEEMDCPGAAASAENVVNCRCTVIPNFDD